MNLVVYHKNCKDGLGAAWAAFALFGKDAEYIPAQYGDEPPEVKGHNIYIVDFSFSKDILTALGKDNLVHVIDHHQTSERDLAGFPTVNGMGLCWTNGDNGVHTYFNMKHSGAVLAWKFFHSKKPTPKALMLIEDRDLWKFIYPGSNPFHYYLRAHTGLSLEGFSQIVDRMETPDGFSEIIGTGKLIEDYTTSLVEQVCSNARLVTAPNSIVVVCNSPLFQSEVGARLLELHPEAKYADVCYTIPSEGSRHSLRSRKGSDVDVAEIAEKHGGGGHKHASGFTIAANTGKLE